MRWDSEGEEKEEAAAATFMGGQQPAHSSSLTSLSKANHAQKFQAALGGVLGCVTEREGRAR